MAWDPGPANSAFVRTSRARIAHSGADASQWREVQGEAGLHVTPARLTALGFMRWARRVRDHAGLESALASQPIDRVTRYRTPDKLAEAGLLVQSIASVRVARDAPMARADQRHPAHFGCNPCGRRRSLSTRPQQVSPWPEGFEAAQSR